MNLPDQGKYDRYVAQFHAARRNAIRWTKTRYHRKKRFNKGLHYFDRAQHFNDRALQVLEPYFERAYINSIARRLEEL